MKHQENAKCLSAEFEWYAQLLQLRFANYFKGDKETDLYELKAPDLTDDPSPYAKFIRKLEATCREIPNDGSNEHDATAERIMLLTALAPHLKPEILDIFFTRNTAFDRGFTEFGGIKGKQHGGFLPTGETVLFILAGGDLAKRMRWFSLFKEEHYFYHHNVLRLEHNPNGEPLLSGALTISEEFLTRFTTGAEYQPRYTSKFPAEKLETKLEWKELVVEQSLREDIEEVLAWSEHADKIMNEWQLDRILKPGYRALFHGPPGTGKTLTATLIGKKAKKPVYRVDLSQLVSKFIGETEKNLASIFESAEHRDWILFFDEADALFGKRTNAKDAHDRYANQETSYLLQRIESFDGIIILATNLKSNLDAAFARRFQATIYFPMPGPSQRLQLWTNALRPPVAVEDQVDLRQLASEYEVSGGEITNIVRFASLSALRRGDHVLGLQDLVTGIRKEFRKQGKTA